MNEEKLEQVLEKVEPAKRSMLRKLVVGAAFAVPVIASFSIKELAQAGVGSMGGTTFTTVTDFTTEFEDAATTITTTVTVTTITMFSTTSTITTTIT